MNRELTGSINKQAFPSRNFDSRLIYERKLPCKNFAVSEKPDQLQRHLSGTNTENFLPLLSVPRF